MSYPDTTQEISSEAKANLESLVVRVFSAVRPPPKLTVSEWAEAERYLSPESSAEHGKWHNSRAPHLIEPMNALSPSDPCQEVVLMFPSQDGKTEILNNFVGYIIDRDPGPTLVIQPNVKPMAETWSKDRLAPMIRDTPCLNGKVADARSRDSGNTIGHKAFPGGQIAIAGANSPAGLASRPIRYLLLDEIDRYPQSAGSEGSPIKLSEKRTRRFWNRKILKVSSPTEEDVGIHAEYQRSDQREWQMQCPDCGEFQFPKLKHFVWEKENGEPKNIRYICEHCGVEHSEDKEYAIKHSGKWVITAPGDSKPKGFWKNQLSSLFISWSDTVREWLSSQTDTESQKTFINTALAEPWIDQGDEVDDKVLHSRREHYSLDVPKGAQVITAAIDVQDDRFEYEIVGWGAGEESWGIKYGRLYGDLDKSQIWDSLTKKIFKTYIREDQVKLDVMIATIDSGGHFTDEVYAWCKKVGILKAIPIKGSSIAGKPVADFPRKKNKNGLYLTIIGTDTAKEIVYNRYNSVEPGPGYCHFPVADEYDQEYFKQITAEVRLKKYRKGVPYYEWVNRKGRRNEASDIRVYNLAAIRILQQHAGVDLDALADKQLTKETVIANSAPKRRMRNRGLR